MKLKINLNENIDKEFIELLRPYLDAGLTNSESFRLAIRGLMSDLQIARISQASETQNDAHGPNQEALQNDASESNIDIDLEEVITSVFGSSA